MKNYFPCNRKLFSCFFALFISFCVPAYCVDSIITHKVQSGETLWEIAQKYNVSVNNIIELNKIRNHRKISKNQVLKIPVKGTKSVAQPSIRKEKRKAKKKVYVSPAIEQLISKNGTYHRVKKGETLWEISKMYNVPVGTIISANGIDSPNSIKVGNKLFIPVEQEISYKKENRDFYRAGVKQQVKNLISLPIFIRARRWQYIVIHHSGTDAGNAKLFNYYHKYKRHMTYGLAYHFVITNGNKGTDGKIEVGDRWKRQLHGGHVKSDFFNEVGIGICLVGNFEKYPPSAAQFQSTLALVQALQEKYHIPTRRVMGHKDIHKKHTLCPGKYFPIIKLKNLLSN